MAQTIQIKRSTGNAAPSSSLAAGELAYSFLGSSHKLYIGDGTNNHVIGGKSFTDKLDGIANNANNYILPTATDSVLGGVKIGSGISITDGVISADSVTTTAVSNAGALMKTGGTMTGDLVLGTSGSTQAKISSASDLPLEFVGNLTFNTTLGNTLNYQLEGTNKMKILLSSVAPSASPADTTVEEIIFSAEEHTSTNSKFRFRTRNSANTNWHDLVEFDHASTGSKHYHEDVLAFSTQTGGITTASHGDSSQWNAAYGYGNHATAGYLSSSGGTMTGNIVMGNDNKVIFGSSTDGLIIDNTTATSGAKRIQEVGSGQLAITGESVFIGHTEDYENDTNDGGLVLGKNGGTSYLNYMVDQSQMLRIQDGQFTIGDTAYVDSNSSAVASQAVKGVADDDAFYANSNQLLATQQSIKAYVDTTNYTNSNLTNYLANAATVNFSHFTFQDSTLKSGGTMTLDPAAHVGDSGAVGTVVIEGDLQVKGTTTTIDSNTVLIGDSEIILNSDLANNTAPSEDAGFRVNRGNENAVYINWDESADNWMLNDGSTSSVITHSNSTIDGGTFS